MRIAGLYAELRARASCERTLSLHGRFLSVYSRCGELATAACRSMSVWQTSAKEGGANPDDVCVVERCSRAGYQIEAVGRAPSRSYHHPVMGTFIAYDLDDGAAVLQPGRGALLCSATGEMVWLVEDELLAGEQGRWPNLTDLAIVITSEILRRGGSFLAHAGGIGRQGRCLLLTGESGSGKTTLTVRKVTEGWDFYGDDMVIVGRDPSGLWRAHPYWRPVHLTSRTLELLGDLRVQSTEFTASNKVECDIAELASVRRPLPGLIEAVLCIQPGQHPRTPEPLSKGDALSVLGATFLSGFNPRNAELDLDNLLEFLAATPAYQVSWSTESQAIDCLLDSQNTHAEKPQI